MLPFTCWPEVATNQNICSKIRIDLLKVAFENFYIFSLQILFVPKAFQITITNTKTFFIKSTNSLIGLAHVLVTNEEVGIVRIGTLYLKIFLTRLDINVISTIAGNEFLQRFNISLFQLKIFKEYVLVIIEKRINTGGVHINQDSKKMNIQLTFLLILFQLCYLN